MRYLKPVKNEQKATDFNAKSVAFLTHLCLVIINNTILSYFPIDRLIAP